MTRSAPGNFNRIRAILDHLKYGQETFTVSLASETGLSRAEIKRVIDGTCSPSLETVLRITSALERHLGKSIDPRDVVSFTGAFPTDLEDLCARPAATMSPGNG